MTNTTSTTPGIQSLTEYQVRRLRELLESGDEVTSRGMEQILTFIAFSQKRSVDNVLDHAVNSAIRFATEPVSFLATEISGFDDAATAHEFVGKLSIYPFYRDFLSVWIAELPDRPTREAAEAVIQRVTRAVVSNMPLSTFLEMIEEACTLITTDEGFSRTALQSLLNSFELSAIASKLDLLPSPIRSVDVHALFSAEPKPHETSFAQAPPTDNYSEFLSELKEAGVVIPASTKKNTPKQKKLSIEVVERTEAKPPPVPTETKPQVRKTAKVTQPLTSAQQPGLERLLSPEAKEKIVTKIFRDDPEDFLRSMSLINNAKDWKQASIYLDALFMRRKVDPYSKTAVRLTDAVYARFNSM